MKDIWARLASLNYGAIAKRSAIAIVALVTLVFAVIYGGSSWRLSQTYDLPPVVLREVGRPASAVRGEQLSKVMGCQGCHGTAGVVFFDVPMVGRLIAPNLTRAATGYSETELAALLRQGIKRDRTSVVVMPADAYAWLADEDVLDLIAWLKSTKPLPDATDQTTHWRVIGRLAMVIGGVGFSADEVKPATPSIMAPTSPPLKRGEYLEHVLCSACHRMSVEHEVRPGDVAPPLAAVAQAYDGAAFAKLLHEGLAMGDRKLGLMSEVAVNTFKYLEESDIAALHAYLNSLKLEALPDRP